MKEAGADGRTQGNEKHAPETVDFALGHKDVAAGGVR